MIIEGLSSVAPPPTVTNCYHPFIRYLECLRRVSICIDEISCSDRIQVLSLVGAFWGACTALILHDFSIFHICHFVMHGSLDNRFMDAAKNCPSFHGRDREAIDGAREGLRSLKGALGMLEVAVPIATE